MRQIIHIMFYLLIISEIFASIVACTNWAVGLGFNAEYLLWPIAWVCVGYTILIMIYLILKKK
jgi:hypothetical protein